MTDSEKLDTILELVGHIAEKVSAQPTGEESVYDLPPNGKLTKAAVMEWAAKFPTRGYRFILNQETFTPQVILITPHKLAPFGGQPVETIREVQL